MFLCPVTFTIPDRSTFPFFSLLTTVLQILWLVNFFAATLKNSTCKNALHHIIYFVFLHWLYFKPHIVIWPPVCFEGEVKWTIRLQVLRSATHKLLKKSYWASFSTNGKHSWLKIAVLCVQYSLSGFGLPFSELKELHATVVIAKLEVIHSHVVMFFRPRRPKCWLSNHHIVLTNASGVVLPNLLSFLLALTSIGLSQ